ncbi:MAG: EAL domain-containing protein [Clostridiales bacterium]|nr:EAL domain-containing protein [Clostridiales bacterium]
MDTSAGIPAESKYSYRQFGFSANSVRRTILIIDGNPTNRNLLCNLLKDEYDIIEAESGLDAIEILKDCKDKVSLIVIDMILPLSDGQKFMEFRNRDPFFSLIPVVAATVKDGEGDEISTLSYGASDYITKPYNKEIILHRFANLINLRESTVIMNLLEYDRLTGVYSREFFYRHARAIIDQNPNKKYDIICSDVESFKLINDSYGIDVGDALLCGIADMCGEYTKERGICGRLGGDIFACLIESGDDYSDESMGEYIQRLNSLTPVRNLVMNFGIYHITDTSLPVGVMCDRAILAIGSIKGKFNRYVACYDNEIREKILLAQTITDSMETALEEKQFKVYLQPKVNIRNGKITGAEALVRWLHPEKGFLQPMEFIPIFEKNGFITKLDQYMWEETCRIIRGWIDSGMTAVPVSVNVSRSDIYNLDLPETMLNLVNKYGLHPEILHLEITETAYTENPKQIIEATTRLREAGFIIEMDDFGTGYSSLNMLSDLPVDTLKLDMKLVQSDNNDSGSRNILNFVVSLAKWMNLLIIAEGVETQEQVNRLKYLNCNYAQGYFYARPMPEEDFTKLLSESPIDDEVISCVFSPPNLELTFCDSNNKDILLIIHSSGENRCMLQETFSGQYCVAEAGNFDSALKFLKENHSRIVTIILDVLMPSMDGFELVSILKHDERLESIPIIITADEGDGLELRSIDIGADDFIAKPYYPEVISRRVRNLVDLCKYRRLKTDTYKKDKDTAALN